MPQQPASNFNNLRVAAFESRRADDMARLIERHGGRPFVSPSMREVPLGSNPAAAEFARRVLAGEIDVTIFLTGVGFRHLLDEVAHHVDREEFLRSLRQTTIIARGPKPVVAMKEVDVTPDLRVREPNTWRELLELVDADVSVAGQTVALQEYGQPNQQLVDGLESRGASVVSIAVYRWELPQDTAPLEDNVRAIAAGERDVALFTSAHQVVNMLKIANQCEVVESFRTAMQSMIIASIGPTTSETLRNQGFHVDLEPEHPRMGNLVAAAGEKAAEMLAAKRISRQ